MDTEEIHFKGNQAEYVSIVIPVFNEEQYLSDCLSSIRGCNYPKDSYEIIVVDNGSSDNSREIAQAFTKNLLVYPDVNVGAVRNYGAKHARGDIIVFLDSDCTVRGDWIQSGVDYLNSKQKMIVGGCVFLREEPSWVERLWLLQKTGQKFMQKDLLGSCIFIRKSDFKLLEGFDESVTSGEDSDLSLRAKQVDFNVQIHESLGVVHLGNPVTIRDFVNRQLWHSENYIRNLSGSLRDPVFWMTCAYSAGWLILLTEILTISSSTLLSMILICSPPMVLSIKRMVRARFSLQGEFPSLPGIYLLDHLYLAGRSLGLLKGLGNAIINRRL